MRVLSNNGYTGAETAPRSLSQVDIDWASFTIEGVELSETARQRLDGGTSHVRNGHEGKWVAGIGPDVQVVYYPEASRLKVAGSPHKLLRGESHGEFGPEEMRAYAAYLADLLGIPVGSVLDAPVRRLDLAANVLVRHTPEDYLRAMRAPPRMETFDFGSTRTFKNSLVEVTGYDKARKMRAKGAGHLIPGDWAGRHVLRLEVRLKKPEREVFSVAEWKDGRRVTMADLCDERLYRRLISKWHERVRSIQPVHNAWTVPEPISRKAMVDDLATLGMEASGGVPAMLRRIERVDRDGRLEDVDPRRMRRWVRDHAGPTEWSSRALLSGLQRRVDAIAEHSFDESIRRECFRPLDDEI